MRHRDSTAAYPPNDGRALGKLRAADYAALMQPSAGVVPFAVCRLDQHDYRLIAETQVHIYQLAETNHDFVVQ